MELPIVSTNKYHTQVTHCIFVFLDNTSNTNPTCYVFKVSLRWLNLFPYITLFKLEHREPIYA